jgi:hypothetical protein
MPLAASPARAGLWLDTDVPCTAEILLAVVNETDAEGIWRYVPLPSDNDSEDISLRELARICSTRKRDGQLLQCGLIQHPRRPELNDLTAHPAEVDAAVAFEHAVRVGYPTPCHIGLDYEGLSQIASNTRGVCIRWAIGWETRLLEAKYSALLYHGYAVPLSAIDLYDLPGFNQYWTDAADRPVAERGNSIVQGAAVTIGGCPFDRNELKADRRGDVPTVCSWLDVA